MGSLLRVFPFIFKNKIFYINNLYFSWMRKSFFEYLGIADIERVHSQFFAWIFSSDCQAIDSTYKNDLLKKLQLI